MDGLNNLDSYTQEIAAAANILGNYLRNSEGASSTTSIIPHLSLPSDAPAEAHRARRNVLANLAKIHTLLTEPTDFLQQLSGQSQLLASLHWLGTFQVLACIPLSGSVPAKDVSDLAGVPESQLIRIVRMTATAGFLCEPTPDHIAHTPLSAQFVTKPSYLDALLFLAEVQAPSALHMAAATQRSGSEEGEGIFGTVGKSGETPYNIAFNTQLSFQAACEQKTKLQRQWPTFLRYAGDVDDGLTEVLTKLDWSSLGSASVVEVGAQSTATAMVLADLYPSLHIFVQMHDDIPTLFYPTSHTRPSTARPRPISSRSLSTTSLTSISSTSTSTDPSSRITVQKRQLGAPQPIPSAQVYILRLPTPSPSLPSASLHALITAELQSHVAILRASPSATLLVTTRTLPTPGSVDPDVERVARSRDLALLQVSGERELECRELEKLIEGAGDDRGSLVVMNRVKGRKEGTIVALGVKYQAFGV